MSSPTLGIPIPKTKIAREQPPGTRRYASNSFLQSYIAERKPNDTIKLTIFRFDKLRDVTFKLGANMRSEYSFKPVDKPNDDQLKLYREYMKAELVK